MRRSSTKWKPNGHLVLTVSLVDSTLSILLATKAFRTRDNVEEYNVYTYVKGGSVLSKYVVYFESYRVSEWSCQITFGLVIESGRVSCREGKFPAWINLIGFVCHDHVVSVTYGSYACISCGLRARWSHKLYTRKSNTDKISRRPNETNPQRVVDSISFTSRALRIASNFSFINNNDNSWQLCFPSYFTQFFCSSTDSSSS